MWRYKKLELNRNTCMHESINDRDTEDGDPAVDHEDSRGQALQRRHHTGDRGDEVVR